MEDYQSSRLVKDVWSVNEEKQDQMNISWAPYPSFRVEQGNPPFFRSGIDFFEPIYVKQKRSRVKKWDCIFVCMSVRAVHIELAESLDTDSFINAMQRFINRRGHPSLIVSDCGTNFKGAVNELEMETSKLDHN